MQLSTQILIRIFYTSYQKKARGSVNDREDVRVNCESERFLWLTREPPEPPFVHLASLSLFVPQQRQRQRQWQTQRQRQRQRQIQRRRLPNLHLCLSLSLNKDSDKDNDKRNVKDKDKYSAAVCPTCIFVSLCPSTAQWRALCCGSSSHQIIQWFLMEGDSELILPNIHWKSLLRKYIVGHTSVW